MRQEYLTVHQPAVIVPVCGELDKALLAGCFHWEVGHSGLSQLLRTGSEGEVRIGHHNAQRTSPFRAASFNRNSEIVSF